jgi:cytochrome c oxidase cbb3-type subunit 3
MIAWEKTMRPKQIAAMANYILSLQGSNPAGAKAPQGNKL